MENNRRMKTSMIVKALEATGADFYVCSDDIMDRVIVPHPIPHGPQVNMELLVIGRAQNIRFQVSGLLNDIPKRNRAAVLEVCNDLNFYATFAKFLIGIDDSVDMEYNISGSCPAACLNKVCLDVLADAATILDDNYSDLLKVICQEDGLDGQDDEEEEMSADGETDDEEEEEEEEENWEEADDSDDYDDDAQEEADMAED